MWNLKNKIFVSADADPTEEDTIQFDLKVKCTQNPKTDDPEHMYNDHKGIMNIQ